MQNHYRAYFSECPAPVIAILIAIKPKTCGKGREGRRAGGRAGGREGGGKGGRKKREGGKEGGRRKREGGGRGREEEEGGTGTQISRRHCVALPNVCVCIKHVPSAYTYIHTHTHTYIHTYVHAYAYMRECVCV